MNEKRSPLLHSRIRALAERREYVGLTIQAKSCGRDSYDGVRFPVKDKLLPDRLRASTETAPPQTVAYDRDWCCSGLVFLGQKCATCD
jgi:hypothetical protein